MALWVIEYDKFQCYVTVHLHFTELSSGENIKYRSAKQLILLRIFQTSLTQTFAVLCKVPLHIEVDHLISCKGF